jgi:ABC-type lipoprotein release transport system permease subunit
VFVVSLLLAAVGIFACWLPARRAAALNPVNAIRHE